MGPGGYERPVRAVCIGGGTGQPNAIRALRSIGCSVTAIVAMADDGGSTGILRQELGINPPGDVRKCLIAMAQNPDDPFVRAFDQRFPFADNHALGNLVIAALARETGSFSEAVEECSRLLGCNGAVYPSTLDDVVLCGYTRDGREFRGQATLGTGPCALSRVWLDPPSPAAYRPAVRAILEADIVVLGPGSLFTSILPNILVPDILTALWATEALRVYPCPLADMQGETWGLDALEHVQALMDHGMAGLVDVVLVHRPSPSDQGVATRIFQALTREDVLMDAQRRASALSPNVDDDPDPDWYFRPVEVDDGIIAALSRIVPTVIARDFANPENPAAHSVSKLASVLRGLVGSCLSRRR